MSFFSATVFVGAFFRLSERANERFNADSLFTQY
jgi:hypothetical protein